MVRVREVGRLHPEFGVAIDGLDFVRQPTRAAIAVLADALCRERLVVVRGQDLDEAAQLRLASQLGCLVAASPSHRFSRRIVPEVHYETVGGATSRQSFYNEQWHADRTWAREDAPTTMLYAVEVDAGCNATAFADMVSAYESLPQSVRSRIDSWVAFHHAGRRGRCGMATAAGCRTPSVD